MRVLEAAAALGRHRAELPEVRWSLGSNLGPFLGGLFYTPAAGGGRSNLLPSRLDQQQAPTREGAKATPVGLEHLGTDRPIAGRQGDGHDGNLLPAAFGLWEYPKGALTIARA